MSDENLPEELNQDSESQNILQQEAQQNSETKSEQSTEQNNQEDYNPINISFSTFLLKLLAGGVGGTIGSLILILIFVLGSTFLTPLTANYEGSAISPIFIFILIVMVFLSSTIGNIVSTFLLSLTERQKYKRTASAIYQIFLISLIIFLLMTPVYFITTSIDFTIVAYAVALHIIVSAQVSALILEIVSNYRYSILGVYSITFAILMSAGLMFTLANFIQSPAILLFAALPIVWGSIAFMHSLVTMIYGWIVNVYDKDFLSTQTLYGADYGKEIEETEEEIIESNTKDQAGADFLRKN